MNRRRDAFLSFPNQSRFLAVLLGSLVLAGCGRPNAAGGEADPEVQARTPVETAFAVRQTVFASYAGTAPLEAERDALVVAKTGGTVLLKLEVEEGDWVEAGQVLARLDNDRHRLEVERAGANLRRLENEFRRANELTGRNLISNEAYERTRSELETQRAAHELARLELSYTEVRAPISGVIAQRMVREGNLIQLHQTLFRVVSFDPLIAVLNVPEREKDRLRAGQAVQLSVDALGGRSFQGVVARVSPVVDAGSGTFRVTAEFSDDSRSLTAGMFGRLNIVYDTREQALVVPRDALVMEDGRPAVFRIEGEQVQRREVVTGYATGPWIEVLEGLEEGDQVVTIGRSALREGSLVQVVGGSARG